MITAVIALMVLSGVAKAVKDTLAHHFMISIFSRLDPDFWDSSRSWLNKYEKDNYPKPRFLGSTTFFVWTTDGWHLFDTIQSTAWQLALSIMCLDSFELAFYWIFAPLLAIKALVSIPFNLCYKSLLIREKK